MKKARKRNEKILIVHRVVRRIDANNQVRFVQMRVGKKEKLGSLFTKKNSLPRFNKLSTSYQDVILTNIKSLGWMGSRALMEVLPEMERSTLGQLIRRYSRIEKK